MLRYNHGMSALSSPPYRLPVALASDPDRSRGRLIREQADPIRTPYQRDRDRIVHSTAFRRLKYKTQVFVNHEGDHFRTRLTHSLEVSQIARTLSRALGLNEDLAETLALAHDLGHPPFGHAGEEGLAAVMAPYGGFDHNEQALRVLVMLENRYARFQGLNLTWETLEGAVKHNGPLLGEGATRPLPAFIRNYSETVWDLDLARFSSLEAQVAALSDDIAYNSHDIDDGLRAGVFTVEDLRSLPGIGPLFRTVQQKFPHATEGQRTHEVMRRMVRWLVLDVLEQTGRNIRASGAETAADIRTLSTAQVAFSPETLLALREIKAFLMQRLYRHYRVNRMTAKAQRIVADLFRAFMAAPDCLPPDWQLPFHNEGALARRIADYIAGMTDRYAIKEHRRLWAVDLESVG
jgi:dGTPase